MGEMTVANSGVTDKKHILRFLLSANHIQDNNTAQIKPATMMQFTKTVFVRKANTGKAPEK